MSDSVFIIHGRNKLAKNEFMKFLRSLNLIPKTWKSAKYETGSNFISNLRIVSQAISSSTCTVVLLTPDDTAQLATNFGKEIQRQQPRPNVIFEMGYALANVGEAKIIPITFGHNLSISDVEGIHIYCLSNKAEDRHSIVNALRNGGCDIQRDDSDYLASEISGDFSNIEEYVDKKQDTYFPAIIGLKRGAYNDQVVDAALGRDGSINPLEVYTQLKSQIERGIATDLKHLYMGITGASNWISLSEHPAYELKRLREIIWKQFSDILTKIDLGSKKLDIISLGPGDGKMDECLIFNTAKNNSLNHYYGLEISNELLLRASSHLTNVHYLKELNFKFKMIQGDFTKLRDYTSVYLFDDTVNLFSLLGFTFGNYKESELLGKIREGMNIGDYLLLDARLHDFNIDYHKLSVSDKNNLGQNYHNTLNNRFAFSSFEFVSNLSFKDVQNNFSIVVDTQKTYVPKAFNVNTFVTLPKDKRTKFHSSGRKIPHEEIALAFSTLYNYSELITWISTKGFDVVWNKETEKKAILLLKKIN